MSIGEQGEPCLYCGAPTVAFADGENPKHFCQNIGCPLWYQPQEMFEEYTLEDGRTAIREKAGDRS